MRHAQVYRWLLLIALLVALFFGGVAVRLSAVQRLLGIEVAFAPPW